jgi:hypothetical protein
VVTEDVVKRGVKAGDSSQASAAKGGGRPKGTPVAEWNGIPIMPQATAGQEFDANNYSFKFTGTAKEAVDFYDSNLTTAGWSSMVTTSEGQGALLVYSKEDKFLTITVTSADDGTVVWMSLTQ